tara:strand:- start:694 stop:1260 length:567 start_codon:yes stop_codon:yes gene_type:complete
MNGCLIRGGRVIDPAVGRDAVGDVWMIDGRIVDGKVDGVQANEFDATGKIVCPGFIETQATLQEPGWDDVETIVSGTAAAVAGGVTSVACLPETEPVVDNRAAVEFILQQAVRSGTCHVFPLGAVTKNRLGEELAEIGQLVEGGAVALSDGKRAVANAEVMRRGLEYAKMFGCRIFHHPQDPELVAGG